MNNQIVTNIYNKFYVLIKRSKYPINIQEVIYKQKENSYLYNQISNINHSNWVDLWCKKIDYIEYQVQHFENKYPFIEESINYYIGLTENAISYIAKIKNINELLVISHIRILNHDFNNPQNIIIDYKSRDISEYLKFIFLNGTYNFHDIETFLLSLNLDFISCQLIYGRLFYPTFYFDLYNEVLSGMKEEKQIEDIVSRVDEYEDYLGNLYNIMSRIKKIPRITWL